MNLSEAISFYEHSSQGALKAGESPKSGWRRYVIYDGRHMDDDFGALSSMSFIHLSDGRIIATNDLWSDTSDEGWMRSLPRGALIGNSLKTRMCRPMSTEALALIMDMMGGTSSRLKSGLSDREAYDIHQRFLRFRVDEIPSQTMRTYSDSTTHDARFASPEDAALTHFKVDNGSLEPLYSKEQLRSLDPSITPVYILYGDDGLQEGDVIDECYVYEKPGWGNCVCDVEKFLY